MIGIRQADTTHTISGVYPSILLLPQASRSFRVIESDAPVTDSAGVRGSAAQRVVRVRTCVVPLRDTAWSNETGGSGYESAAPASAPAAGGLGHRPRRYSRKCLQAQQVACYTQAEVACVAHRLPLSWRGRGRAARGGRIRNTRVCVESRRTKRKGRHELHCYSVARADAQ